LRRDMKGILSGTLTCLCIWLLLLTGSTPIALGESATGDDAQVAPGGDTNPPGDLPQASDGDGVMTGDAVYYSIATGVSGTSGIVGGVWAGRVIQEVMAAARTEAIVSMPLTDAQTASALASVRVTTTIWGTVAGVGIGLLISAILLFTFVACQVWG
jgi:hypothetical protein